MRPFYGRIPNNIQVSTPTIVKISVPGTNCTPLVIQYAILSNKRGVIQTLSLFFLFTINHAAAPAIPASISTTTGRNQLADASFSASAPETDV